MKKALPLAIIGAGPAGITAAIYAKRANIEPIIFTNEVIGGKAFKTLIIENYPGIKHMTGNQFCQYLEAQINYLKIKVKYEKVLSLSQSKKEKNFQLKTSKTLYQFDKVIVATGTKEKKLPFSKAEKLEGKGISYCSSCDGYFFKNKVITVVGGGNSAVEESKVLAKIGKKVIILNRNANFNAEKMLIKEIETLKNITIKYNTEIKALKGEKKLERLITLTKEGKEEEIATDGLFIYIGSLPNNDFLNFSENILDPNGYILVNKNFESKIKKLYAIGDIASQNIQQYTTAIGSATIAIIDIIKKNF